MVGAGRSDHGLPPFYVPDGGQKNGGDDGDRTRDLRIANATLSQLSYIPTLIADFEYTMPAFPVKD